ncbi:MAG: replication-associated recombination protein A [Myxococcales bacterium]|nr:replication-associated recombination protein A [Myxococcales bacterium]MCB9705737.1 replication-associated recombination protein A [Myxococcales bacterium]
MAARLARIVSELADDDDLFARAWKQDPSQVPLAERMRPRSLAELVGQGHVVGGGRLLDRLVGSGRMPSMILWGPPGVGKTTLARLLAERSRAAFVTLSATSSGVREIREVVEAAKKRRSYEGRGTLLFIDEIHRFNKGQQDALLPHVEAGVIALIGATTENPSFEVNAALLSRARVLQLRELGIVDLVALLRRALEDRERGLGERGLAAPDGLLAAIAEAAQGDARRALGTLELAVDLSPPEATELAPELVAEALGQRTIRYDKAGEEHYNVVSAFIKSMRASDPDAAVYWLARMLEAGEDPLFPARRMIIFASEDIGNADPQALAVANSAAAAAHQVGMPEAVLPLTQAALYLALAPKSNAALKAYAAARRDVRRHGGLPVPLVIRNAITPLMQAARYGVGYKYPHDFASGVAPAGESHLPDRLAGARYVELSGRGWEGEAARRLEASRVDRAPGEGDGEGEDEG